MRDSIRRARRALRFQLLGGPHMGGSTITMQLARLMYGLNTRSVGGKLQQIVRAVQLEMCYSKREILEAHINLMPYGGNIQGVGAASLIYFDKPAARLDIAESLALVLIPQSPARRAPSGREGEELRSARQRLFARWVEEHPRAADSSQHVAMALQFGSMRELPFSAPHFTNYVLQKAEDHSIRTTLDSRLQSLIERVLANYIRERSSTGVHNATAMLVDYRDMSVRAMIGSADFNSAAIDGQVNGTLAKRSPGSALKPFIYALAIDQGLIHPLTVLKDAPTSFGPYSPENFDGRFVGPITATEALTRSRNVPAVALSAQLTQPNLYDFLKVAGVSHLASETPLRSSSHARRRRSDARRTRDALRDARESRPTGTAALSRR
jgi:penicillin-binding protein 1C